MAINQNHTFDDLDGVKCAIVEKNCKPERVEFLKKLLEICILAEALRLMLPAHYM